MRIQDSSTRWLAGEAVVVLALIILSIAVALLNSQGEATLLAEDTPEGTVQRYLLAVEEGNMKAAFQYLSSELQEDCTYSQFRDSTRWFEAEDMQVTLEGAEPLDEEVEVRVRITQFYIDPPFGGLAPVSPLRSGESSYTARYTLEREGETWRLSDPPWPMGRCPGLERPAPPHTSTRTPEPS